ncbi:UDP-N-acetylmuramyl pentapeptide phosphotransferase/UDP-N-acetylglucosamine-1-phosphate transferase [Chitinophaga jiangningensis]|uniref:UDP-N-acetylmuramyl pentapeptide phosphotransferase/UDP-N-acetylglucosamine-1-phosphate transferase n=1 Tax=Chitinophaga jiangningensis TaxID=1419482 RepID=A0A1M7DTB3_9BACT|nr:MraY family glycosyltransferase [Chitinophaga jiangningensis]SHL82623.1 UDP-N-acetylmuramyl pentapeptide phosphotransferase/UDP-N-acetylglucosamine-1-phosphate transferase [Chitinophaga jiangningensis]
MENVLIATVLSFVVTYFSIPILIKVAELKHLYDEPDERKAHKKRIPTLGGMGFFSGFIIAAAVCVPVLQNSPFQYMMAAFFIIFMVGMKDDIVGLSPLKKLIGQLLASFAIIYLGNLQISNMYGFLGIYELPTSISLMLTYFTFIVVINAFNLIDGVDGQAGSIGLLVSAILGAYFLHVGEITYAVLGFSLAGGLASFLIYNISPAKIFMGDTGSLLIGLVNAVLVIKFIDVAGNPVGKMPVTATPGVAIAILIVPLFDTLRVFAVRMLQGRSPFSADRNHIHHYLLDLKLNHKQTTLVSVTVNAIYIAAAFALQGIGTTAMIIVVGTSAMGLTGVLYLARKRKLAAVAAAQAALNLQVAVPENAAPQHPPKILRVTNDGVLQDK